MGAILNLHRLIARLCAMAFTCHNSFSIRAHRSAFDSRPSALTISAPAASFAPASGKDAFKTSRTSACLSGVAALCDLKKTAGSLLSITIGALKANKDKFAADTSNAKAGAFQSHVGLPISPTLPPAALSKSDYGTSSSDTSTPIECASRSRLSTEMFVTARSSCETYVRWKPARSANSSWLSFCSSRKKRTFSATRCLALFCCCRSTMVDARLADYCVLIYSQQIYCFYISNFWQ